MTKETKSLAIDAIIGFVVFITLLAVFAAGQRYVNYQVSKKVHQTSVDGQGK